MMITIFKTPTCAYCAQTIRYLDAKEVPFTVIDVTKEDSREYKALVSDYGSSVPLVHNGKTGYTGWNLRKLNEMIADV